MQHDPMAGENTVSITPSPSALMESLRGLGYSPETAIADLVDNSIAAGCENVWIELDWSGGTPVARILDDGLGMDAAVLAQAMRLGGNGLSIERGNSDLGRFGLGLKTASLSQCRQMSVISRQQASTAALILDVDVVGQKGWFAVVPSALPIHALVSKLQELEHGTLVLWDRFDALSELSGLEKDAFFLRLQDIRAHLGMVFHRFIDGDARRVKISLNGNPVRSWDPFQRAHPTTRPMHVERVRHAGSSFTVRPYVLPHRDRFANDAEYASAGGPGGWAARQGFYVYRGKRLLVAGSWLGLGGARAWAREESSKLARIEIELPTDMDRDWRIDVRKSQARPPGALRGRLTAIARKCREEAREVFAFRGQRAQRTGNAQPADPIWIARHSDTGTAYRINREHPLIAACLAKPSENQSLLHAIFALIERTVPVERIWLDVSEAEGAPAPKLDKEEEAFLVDQLTKLAGTLPSSLSAAERIDAVLCYLPGNVESIKKSLRKKLEGKG